MYKNFKFITKRDKFKLPFLCFIALMIGTNTNLKTKTMKKKKSFRYIKLI